MHCVYFVPKFQATLYYTHLTTSPSRPITLLMSLTSGSVGDLQLEAYVSVQSKLGIFLIHRIGGNQRASFLYTISFFREHLFYILYILFISMLFLISFFDQVLKLSELFTISGIKTFLRLSWQKFLSLNILCMHINAK